MIVSGPTKNFLDVLLEGLVKIFQRYAKLSEIVKEGVGLDKASKSRPLLHG